MTLLSHPTHPTPPHPPTPLVYDVVFSAMSKLTTAGAPSDARHQEQVQTVTAPLHKVRKGKMVWFHARGVQISDREADPMPFSSSVVCERGRWGSDNRAFRKAAHHQWDVSTTDIKTVFLLAPRPVKGAKTVPVIPPRIMTDFGITLVDKSPVWISIQSCTLGGVPRSNDEEVHLAGGCKPGGGSMGGSTSWNANTRRKFVENREKRYVLTDFHK